MKTVTRAEFIDWLKTKPADKPACLDDNNHCVMAEYAREVLGAKDPDAGTWVVWDGEWANRVFEFSDGPLFYEFYGAKTYGQVIDKLENHIDTSDNFTTI